MAISQFAEAATSLRGLIDNGKEVCQSGVLSRWAHREAQQFKCLNAPVHQLMTWGNLPVMGALSIIDPEEW